MLGLDRKTAAFIIAVALFTVAAMVYFGETPSDQPAAIAESVND